jgi:large subunit ribosomal protein L11
MGSQTIDTLVSGGHATAAPPLGPQLGPLGVNIGQVIAAINKKTIAFDGMKVPIKLTVDTDTKEFEIEVGTPPASALIKSEAGIEKGAANPKTDKVADVLIEQIIKIAKMKEENLLGNDLKAKVKEIIGTCNSMGILVEGVPAVDCIKLVNEGKFDEEIRTEKTELTAEEKAKLEQEKMRLAEEMEKRKVEFEKLAKEIIEQMAGSARGTIKTKLKEAGVPDAMIKELLPVEGAADGAAPGADGKSAEAKKEEKK